jgi:hypothetical protein
MTDPKAPAGNDTGTPGGQGAPPDTDIPVSRERVRACFESAVSRVKNLGHFGGEIGVIQKGLPGRPRAA